jgi:ion channel-forming bestrophin family protein
MIKYNPKDWLLFIFKFHKSDTFRKLLPMMLFMLFYTLIILLLEKRVFNLAESSPVKNISLMHSLLGFVISLLLAYRTNTAYDRWWEGRKMWGALINSSRNLAIKLSVILPPENQAYFKTILPFYAKTLKDHLTNAETGLELFDDMILASHQHKPNQVAQWMFRKIHEHYKSGLITGDELIVLNNEIQSFTDICGACERIKNTPIPYSYSSFIKKFIFFFIMSLPFSYVLVLEIWAIPVVVFVFYVLASLEIIAEEIEDPFGMDDNDLPLDKISQSIKQHVEEIFDRTN